MTVDTEHYGFNKFKTFLEFFFVRFSVDKLYVIRLDLLRTFGIIKDDVRIQSCKVFKIFYSIKNILKYF